MESADRAFARVLLAALAAAGLIGSAMVVLLSLGAAPARAGVRSLRCLFEPASSLDVVVHTSALGAMLLGGLVLLAGWRAVSRERAVAAELGWAARMARLPSPPARLVAVAQAAAVAGHLDVVEASRPFGFVYGWARPQICVSTGLVERLTDRELEAVLHHEGWHLARRDPARLLLVRTIAAAFPFAPPVRRLASHYIVATEIAADRHAVAAMGHHRWLAGALIKVMGEPATAPAFVGHAEARIAALLGEPPRVTAGSGRAAVAVLCCELLVLASLLTRGGLPLLTDFVLHPVC